MNIQPWHWFVFGLALMVVEIFAPSFTIFWFGLAAVLLSILLLVVSSLSIIAQLMIWTILSIMMALAWFKWIRPLLKDRTQVGLARENTIGQIGMVIENMPAHHEVIVRFAMPLLGTDEWTCRYLEPVKVGDRVIVVDILGNKLVVKPHSSSSH